VDGQEVVLRTGKESYSKIWPDEELALRLVNMNPFVAGQGLTMAAWATFTQVGDWIGVYTDMDDGREWLMMKYAGKPAWETDAWREFFGDTGIKGLRPESGEQHLPLLRLLR
jgi:hypothetical protein